MLNTFFLVSGIEAAIKGTKVFDMYSAQYGISTAVRYQPKSIDGLINYEFDMPGGSKFDSKNTTAYDFYDVEADYYAREIQLCYSPIFGTFRSISHEYESTCNP